MSKYIGAPSCQISFIANDSSIPINGLIADTIQGQMQVSIQYEDGGVGSRYAYVGEVQGQVQFTDLYYTRYDSPSSTTLDRTTDDVFPGTANTPYEITITYGTENLIALSVCTAQFDYKSIVSKGPALLLQGVYPFRIWDPYDTSA